MAELTATEREQMYTAFLQGEGYKPDLEMNGYVKFDKNGWPYLMPLGEDSEFFLLMSGTGFEVTDEATRARAVKACNRAMADSKVAKVHINDENFVLVSVELFCIPPEAFKAVFARCMTAIDTARDLFLAACKAP